jgi:hypothetical protein
MGNHVKVHMTHQSHHWWAYYYTYKLHTNITAPQKTMVLPLPPLPLPERRIVIVGFLPDNNGRSCALHPFGCGNIVVLQRNDGGVGMLLRVRMLVRDELACFAVNPDGSDGCRVAFAAREYAAGENGRRFDGALVRLVAVYSPEDENRMARRLYYCNCGYAIGEVIDFAV